MNAEALKDVIKQELPGLLREDPALRAYPGADAAGVAWMQRSLRSAIQVFRP